MVASGQTGREATNLKSDRKKAVTDRYISVRTPRNQAEPDGESDQIVDRPDQDHQDQESADEERINNQNYLIPTITEAREARPSPKQRPPLCRSKETMTKEGDNIDKIEFRNFIARNKLVQEKLAIEKKVYGL